MTAPKITTRIVEEVPNITMANDSTGVPATGEQRRIVPSSRRPLPDDESTLEAPAIRYHDHLATSAHVDFGDPYLPRMRASLLHRRKGTETTGILEPSLELARKGEAP